MRMAFRHLKELPKNFKFIADGYSAYPLAAQQFFLELGDAFKFDITQVIRPAVVGVLYPTECMDANLPPCFAFLMCQNKFVKFVQCKMFGLILCLYGGGRFF